MLDLEENIIGKPIAIIGKAIADIFTLNPKSEMSHAVTVVPIFAPMITPTDSTKLSKPAFTKLTIITVVAEDDCKSDVPGDMFVNTESFKDRNTSGYS